MLMGRSNFVQISTRKHYEVISFKTVPDTFDRVHGDFLRAEKGV
jgi:hypothetical protein